MRGGHTLKSFCKINLFLDVKKKSRNAKLHNIQTLSFISDLHDKIVIKKNKKKHDKVVFIGKFKKHVQKKNNSVIKSLFLLRQLGLIKEKNRYKILVEKNIPAFSGLGGGSSNAATVLKYFLRKNQITKGRIDFFSKFLGSDLRLFLNSNQVFQKNLLEVRSLKKNHSFYFILVYPFLKCSTKDIYSKLRVFKKFKNKIDRYQNKSKLNVLNGLKNESNALERVILLKFPKIRKILKELKLIKSCQFSRITGSGSVCFGLFLTKRSADTGLKKIKKKFPKFWCTISKTI